MTDRINRAIELLAQDQAIYYDGPHSGHVLTYAQGREDAATWADYINVGMEHGAFDMTGLAAYMRGMADGGPTSAKCAGKLVSKHGSNPNCTRAGGASHRG